MILSGRRELQRRSLNLLRQPLPFRRLATVHAPSSNHYDAVIIGAGPAGLTCASVLLDHGLNKICMLDPSFTGGRIHERYREVPSNTKTHLFLQWAAGTNTFEEILARLPNRKAFDKLRSFNPDEGCQLGDAIDMARSMSDGLRDDSRVTSLTTKVQRLSQRNGIWSVPEHAISADRVVLASGAHPKGNPLGSAYPHITSLDLDTVLKPSLLREVVPKGATLGVIGSSHSAILALKNLHELDGASVVNFYRSPLLYAVQKDGWILYDNTGLKGVAADWAREVLDVQEGRWPSNLRRVCLRDPNRTEKDIYDAELKHCEYVVSAIGYEANELPVVDIDGHRVTPGFDPLTGKFGVHGKRMQNELRGLYGAGIAFPEKVTDPEGNVEMAVGWLKFMKFLKRVGPRWVDEGR